MTISLLIFTGKWGAIILHENLNWKFYVSIPLNRQYFSRKSNFYTVKLKQTLLCFHRVESVVFLLSVVGSQGLVLILMWYHIQIKFTRGILIPYLWKKSEFIITWKLSTHMIKALINFVECQGFYIFLICAKTVAESALLVSLFIRRRLKVHGYRSLF